jgi:hypothetical protein
MMQKLVEEIRSRSDEMVGAIEAELGRSKPPGEALPFPDQSFYQPFFNIDQPMFYELSPDRKDNKKCGCCSAALTRQRLRGPCGFCGNQVCHDCVPKKRANPADPRDWALVCLSCEEGHLTMQAFQLVLSRELAFRRAAKKMFIDRAEAERELQLRKAQAQQLKDRLDGSDRAPLQARLEDLRRQKYALKADIKKDVELLHSRTIQMQACDEQLSSLSRRLLDIRQEKLLR